MLKAIIVEDEDNSAENLRILVEEFCCDVKVEGIAKSITEAIALINKFSPDIVFLDIHLNGESGFDLFTKIRRVNFNVIFTTAYSDYALQAFRVSALDYLLKPINIKELQEAVDKASRLNDNETGYKLEKLLSQLNSDNPAAKIALPTLDGVYFIDHEDIIFCESDSNYTVLHLVDGQKYVVSKTLGTFEELLPGNLFCRIHNSLLINLSYVKKYNRAELTVTMTNKHVLNVSRRKQSNFQNRMGLNK